MTYVSASGIQLPHEFTGQFNEDVNNNNNNNNNNNTKHGRNLFQSSSAPLEESLEDEFDLDPLDDDSALDETSDSSSDSDMDERRGTTRRNSYTKKKRKAFTTDWPILRLRDIIVFCYLTCLWMRIPVLSNDIHRWCFSYQLPYMKIMDGLPDDFVKRLDSPMMHMFTRVPHHSKIVSRICSYKRAFAHHCKLRFPKANTPILIHRFLSQFYLPGRFTWGSILDIGY